MKKFLSVLTTVAVTMSLMSFGVSASGLSEEKLKTLYDYGIFQGDEKGRLNLENNITRAELCKVIISSLGISEEVLTDKGQPFFNDADDTHWGYLYIQNAKTLSLIDGYEDGSFKPDSGVTLNETLKIVIDALGYETKATELGGYPDGYKKLSEEFGFTTAQTDYSKTALRKEAAEIIYSALDVPLMKITGFGADKTYAVMDGTEDNALENWNLILSANRLD